MQVLIDMLQRRKEQGTPIENLTGVEVSKIAASVGLDDNSTDLEFLQGIIKLQTIIHRWAGDKNLPLDQAYSAVLVQGTVADKENLVDPVPALLGKYRDGKLAKSSSSEQAIVDAYKEIERQKNVEIHKLKEIIKDLKAQLAAAIDNLEHK